MPGQDAWKPLFKRNAFLAIAVVVFAVLAILVLWLVMDQVVWLWSVKGINSKDLFKARNDALATFAQMLGGFALLIGLYFAWRNISTTNQNVELTKEGQVTERFTKAIEQLGAADDKGKRKLELRLGGIYALERIARDSKKDHWPIMEILTAYVRENAPYVRENEAEPERAEDFLPLTTDIQAVLTVIRRRECSYEKSGQHLDLHGADLHRANLQDAHLEGADLSRVHLEGADLEGAHLEGANLGHADLWCANLGDAHLEGANLNDADLFDAFLEGADLKDAFMFKTNVRGQDLDSANGVTQRQVNSADGDITTKLPDGLVMPDSWKKQKTSS